MDKELKEILNQVLARLDSLDRHMDSLEKPMDSLEKRVGTPEKQISEFQDQRNNQFTLLDGQLKGPHRYENKAEIPYVPSNLREPGIEYASELHVILSEESDGNTNSDINFQEEINLKEQEELLAQMCVEKRMLQESSQQLETDAIQLISQLHKFQPTGSTDLLQREQLASDLQELLCELYRLEFGRKDINALKHWVQEDGFPYVQKVHRRSLESLKELKQAISSLMEEIKRFLDSSLHHH